MKITITDNSVCSIELREFPQRYDAFFDSTDVDKKTMEIEEEGAKLLKNGFADSRLVNEFVKSVLSWGGPTGNRVRGLVYKHQNEIEVAQVVGEAAAFLRKGDLESAIGKITELKGLSISYGSKILRMLSPQQVGVYDSVLQKVLSYPANAAGCVEFSADCGKVAGELEKRGIQHPRRKNGAWLVADVEAVIFHKLLPKKDPPKKDA